MTGEGVRVGADLYEQMMALAIDFGHAAEKMREGLDPDENHGPEDEMADEIAKVYDEAHRRIAAILNGSELADVAGSTSCQHYIETGVRLPRGTDEPCFCGAFPMPHTTRTHDHT